MANKVKFGLSNVHIAKITYGDNQGTPTITYGTPFALAGAVNLTLDAEGDTSDFFADNTKYFSSAANNGYSGSLEVALINDTFRTTILGETVDSKGAYIENKDDTISDFALGFQIEGDEVGRRFWFYCVSATRPSTASQTIETSKEPVTETLNITASARITDGAIKCFMEKTSGNTTQYNGFFSNVYEKTPSA